ncbi:hypothetical protein M0R45_029445 [Rubus argutus]|uniref:Uncharacterized protein n=1 Tax=Rubus argutus TaxID=59490 RepID=A0AAW1W913_RUBAR
MAEKIRFLGSWIEVAPALLICPKKTSTSPELETITEEIHSHYSIFHKLCLSKLGKKLIQDAFDCDGKGDEAVGFLD